MTTQQPHTIKRTLLSVALASVGVMGLANTASAQDDTFKVGFVTFLSGGASGPIGVPAAQGAEIVINAINEGTTTAHTTKKATVSR